MAGETLGALPCDCGDGGTVQWTTSKTSQASGKCLKCGEQRFKRSPLAVDNLKKQLARGKPAQGDKSAPSEKGKGAGVLGEPFDLGKL